MTEKRLTAPGAPLSTPAARGRHLGVLALVAIAPVWGYSWVVTKVALAYCRPLTFAVISTAVCVACLSLVLVATHRRLRPPPLGWTALIGFLQTTLFAGLATVALDQGGAGKVSVLAYTMPFWLLLLAWLFLGDRVHGLQWAGVALAFAGLVLVVRPWAIGGVLSGVLACAAGLAWAGGALAVKLLQRRTHVDVISLTAWQMGLGALPLIVAAVLTHSGWPQWTGTFVLCLGYSGILANAVCWVLWIYALRTLRAGVAGLGTLAIPVVGVFAAWLQLGERPSVEEAAGMALIIAALALLSALGIVAGRRGPGAGATGEDAVLQPVID
jgi:drug/metabolite transporter (DMT)-like permease